VLHCVKVYTVCKLTVSIPGLKESVKWGAVRACEPVPKRIYYPEVPPPEM
jgi:hypothetical protein